LISLVSRDENRAQNSVEKWQKKKKGKRQNRTSNADTEKSDADAQHGILLTGRCSAV